MNPGHQRIEIRLALVVQRLRLAVFQREAFTLCRAGKDKSRVSGDHLLVTAPKALRLALLVSGLPHEALYLLQAEKAVHVVVVPQEIARERLRLTQPAELGGDRLELLDEGVRRRVAGYGYGPVVEHVDASVSGHIQRP